jgi:hypothetical protein
MIRYFFVVFISMLFVLSGYCQKIEVRKSPITGTWIETSNKTDTLVFLPEYDGQDPIFQLRRGSAPNDRTHLPKIHSGPYWYRLGKNRIAVQSFLSSTIGYKSYYFWLSDDQHKLKIGNFFKDGTLKSDTLTFIRKK